MITLTIVAQHIEVDITICDFLHGILSSSNMLYAFKGIGNMVLNVY